MHARPAATTGTVARAAFRGAAGFTLGITAFFAVAFVCLAALVIGGIVALATILSHLPADTLPR